MDAAKSGVVPPSGDVDDDDDEELDMLDVDAGDIDDNGEGSDKSVGGGVSAANDVCEEVLIEFVTNFSYVSKYISWKHFIWILFNPK